MKSVNNFKDIEKIYEPEDSGYKKVKRGQIYYIEKIVTVGSEQTGGRPAIIVGNDIGNEKSSVVLVVYLTTAAKRWMPTHVAVQCKEPSTALCEQVFTIDKSRIGDYIRTATESEMREIDKALSVSFNLVLPEITINENDDSLVKTAVERIKTISCLVDNIREMNQTEDQVKESRTIGFVGNGLLTLDGILSPKAIQNIREVAIKQVELERKVAKDRLEDVLGPVECTEVEMVKPEKKSGNKKIDDKKAMEMLSAGKTQKEMADAFNVHPSSISLWVKKHKADMEDLESDKKCVNSIQ